MNSFLYLIYCFTSGYLLASYTHEIFLLVLLIIFNFLVGVLLAAHGVFE